MKKNLLEALRETNFYLHDSGHYEVFGIDVNQLGIGELDFLQKIYNAGNDGQEINSSLYFTMMSVVYLDGLIKLSLVRQKQDRFYVNNDVLKKISLGEFTRE